MTNEVYANKPEDSMRITGIHGIVNSDGMSATLQWIWPDDQEWNYALVVEFTEGQNLTPELMMNGEIVKRTAFINPYNIRLTKPLTRYIVYPLKENDTKNGYIGINQIGEKENLSDYLHRPATIEFKLDEHKLGLFSNLKEVSVNLYGTEKIEEVISFACVGGNRGKYMFPIDLRDKSWSKFSLVLNKNENIRFILNSEQSKYITLLERREN